MDLYLYILIGLSSLFSLLTVYFHLKVFSYWRVRGIPGPTPWPIFGTTIYYLLENKIDLEERWKRTYGHTYGLFEGYSPLLRTSDLELIKQIYIKKHQSFIDRHDAYVHQPVQKRWILWSPGDLWVNQRALVSPMFSASKMRTMMDLMLQGVDRFVGYAETKMAAKKAPGSFNKFDLSSLTLDVIATSFFGLRLDTYKVRKNPDDFVLNAYRLADFKLARFLVWTFLPRQLAKLFKYDLFPPSTYEYLSQLSKNIIAERKKPSSVKRNDIIQLLIDAKLPEKNERVYTELDDQDAHYNANVDHNALEAIQQEQTKKAVHFKKFSDLDMQGIMTFFFVAGFETTASTLTFAMYALAHQPQVQEELRAELIEAFGPNGEELSGQSTSEIYAKLLGIKKLEAFVSELLRLYNPIIEHNRKVTVEEGIEIDVNGRPIYLHQNVPIATSAHVVHRDPENFERPDEFDLTRFYPENRHKIRAGSYVPFGLGPRHCVGMRFALVEVKTALAKVLLRFKVVPERGSQYPPKFKQNVIFLQFESTKFGLAERDGIKSE